MFGVAEYMSKHAEKYGCDAEEMYVLGLLHDIGYIYGAENHGKTGSILMQKLGYNDSEYINWHDILPEDYKSMTHSKELPNKLRLLLTADLSVNSKGEDIGFDGRLEDIKTRYGEGSPQFKNVATTIAYLKKEN